MPAIEHHTPGMFCWYELGTTDLKGATEFYLAIFGWSAEDVPMGEGETYTMFKLHERDAAGGYRLSRQMLDQGIPPHWMPYICVADADATAAKAKALGAMVIQEPFDVDDIGRMAVLTDPTGAAVSLWQPLGHIGSGVVMEPGTACWWELLTNDTAKAAAFYSDLLGWGTKASTPGYTEFLVGNQSHAGMMEILPEWGPMPTSWMTYFMVEDCDATVEKAISLGATSVMPAMDIENVGRAAMLRDPHGAHFYVIHLQGQ